MRAFTKVALLAAGLAGGLGGCADTPQGPPTAPSDEALAQGRGGQHPAGTFTSISMPGATGGTLALDINLFGVVVGRYRASDGTHGFIRSRTGELSTLDVPGAFFTVAAGINVRGDIVGMYSSPDDPDMRHGYVRQSDGTLTTIDPPGSVFTNALGINAEGDIVGRYFTDESDNTQAFLYHRGTFTTLSFPGADGTNAWKINALGEVVGSYTTSDGSEQLFMWRRGKYTAVPLPNGKPVSSDNGGVNLGGDIVGIYCDDADCGIAPGVLTHGFLLSRGSLTTIDYPGAVATSAIGINLQRDIVGSYFDADGVIHGYLLTSGGHANAQDEEGAY